jgi:hypothetical protein
MRGLIYKDLYLIKNKVIILAASLLFVYILMFAVILLVHSITLTPAAI